MRKLARTSIPFIITAQFLTCCSPQASEVIVVSAAASLTNPLTVLQANFEADHPSVKVVFNFGGSGTLRARRRSRSVSIRIGEGLQLVG